mmetsp:Transcript_10321/g.14157  ORF Transcript_10321/g.14157 Transcript_10321/m.14157 type:complete len:138 (+) Transcript_10321:234-647(+)
MSNENDKPKRLASIKETFKEQQKENLPSSFNTILNLEKKDPFASDFDEDQSLDSVVDIRIQQRAGRKWTTTVQGLSEVECKSMLSTVKKNFCCNGTLIHDKEMGAILQLSGDQRKNLAMFLMKEKGFKKDRLKIHGV